MFSSFSDKLWRNHDCEVRASQATAFTEKNHFEEIKWSEVPRSLHIGRETIKADQFYNEDFNDE